MVKMDRPGIALRLAELVALAAGLGACTIVRVGDGGGVRTTYYPGMAVIHVTRGDAMQVVEAESVGAAVVGDRATLGWSHSRIALVPPERCQLIVWDATAAQLAELRRLFGERSEICNREGGAR